MNSNDGLVEFIYKYKRHTVKIADLENPQNKVIMLPDGTVLDRSNLLVDNADKHGNKLSCSILRHFPLGPGYSEAAAWPIIGVIQAEAADS